MMNVKIILRNLIKNKTVSSINLVGLIIGFISCLFISLYVYHEKSYDTFHKNFNNIYRLVNVRHFPSHTDLSAGCVSLLGPALKQDLPEVLDFARCYNTSDVFTYNNNVVHFKNIFGVDSSFFNIFSFPVIEGKTSQLLTLPYTVVITESAAKRLFGNKCPIGETITRSGSRPYVIEAVINDAPPNSSMHFDLLFSLVSEMQNNNGYCYTCNNKNTFILLADNTNTKNFESKLQQIIPKIHEDEGFKREYKLQTLAEIHLTSKLRFELGNNGDAKNVIFLTIVAALIIVIAWFNYINLSVSIAIGRSKEVGIKKIIGSSKKSLIFEFLSEAFLVNTVALLIALIIVKLSLPFFSSFIPSTQLFNNINFWIILILALVAGTLIYGIYPSFVISSFKPLRVLKGKSDRPKNQYHQRVLLVTFQFAISIILIATSLFVYRQVSFMKNKELGMNINQTLVIPRAQVYLQNVNYNGRRETFITELLKNPSIQEIAYASSLPGEENGQVSGGIRAEGTSLQAGQQIYSIQISKNYFSFLEIKFASGKNFSSDYRPKEDGIPIKGNDQPLVINETACRYLGFSNPNEALDKMIINENDKLGRIIGVVKDHHNQSIDKPINPVIYNCVSYFSYFLIKTKTGNIPQTIKLIENKYSSLYPGNPFEYFFLDEFFDAQYSRYSQFAITFSIFTILAIIVACIGLLGLVIFTTKLATKEIGIRKVNGARVADVMAMLNADFIKWVAIAFIIACPITYYAMLKWLQNFAYKTELSWWVFAVAGVIALVIAILTVSWQSWRAATRNPVEALRYE